MGFGCVDCNIAYDSIFCEVLPVWHYCTLILVGLYIRPISFIEFVRLNVVLDISCCEAKFYDSGSKTFENGCLWVIIVFLSYSIIFYSSYLIIVSSLFIWFFSCFWLFISNLSNLNCTNFCSLSNFLTCWAIYWMFCFTFWESLEFSFLVKPLVTDCTSSSSFFILSFIPVYLMLLFSLSWSIDSLRCSWILLSVSIFF